MPTELVQGVSGHPSWSLNPASIRVETVVRMRACSMSSCPPVSGMRPVRWSVACVDLIVFAVPVSVLLVDV